MPVGACPRGQRAATAGPGTVAGVPDPTSTPVRPATLTLASTNAGKLASLRAVCLDTAVVAVDLPLVETQTDDAADVAAVAVTKAVQAWRLLGAPVVVEDGGLCVDHLGGWPGVYTKPFLASVGLSGLLQLAGPLPARAHFRSAVAYADGSGLRVWTGPSRLGTLVPAAGEPAAVAWSALWSVFAPDGGDGRTLAQLSAAERHALVTVDPPLTRFGRWWATGSDDPGVLPG